MRYRCPKALTRQRTPTSCHPREGGDPGTYPRATGAVTWMPASAGMTQAARQSIRSSVRVTQEKRALQRGPSQFPRPIADRYHFVFMLNEMMSALWLASPVSVRRASQARANERCIVEEDVGVGEVERHLLRPLVGRAAAHPPAIAVRHLDQALGRVLDRRLLECHARAHGQLLAVVILQAHRVQPAVMPVAGQGFGRWRCPVMAPEPIDRNDAKPAPIGPLDRAQQARVRSNGLPQLSVTISGVSNVALIGTPSHHLRRYGQAFHPSYARRRTGSPSRCSSTSTAATRCRR